MNFLCLKNYLNTYCLLRKSSALELLHYSSAQLPMFELNCESKWKPSDRNEQEGAIREPIKIKLVIAILLRILLLVVLGYLQERRTYGCSGCTCTHSFPAPSRSCTYTCTGVRHPRYLVQISASVNCTYLPILFFSKFLLNWIVVLIMYFKMCVESNNNVHCSIKNS